MKVTDLVRSLQRQPPGPLYVVVGEEDYLRDQAVATLKHAVLGGDPTTGETAGGADGTGGLDSFNYDLIYADETDAQEILARAGEIPVFAQRRLLLVRQADKLTARDGDILLPYLKSPCDSTTLVFVAGKLDGRLKFSQALKTHAVTVECTSPPDTQLTEWIKAEAKVLNLQVSDDAVMMLKETAGGLLSLIRREMEKLASYVQPGTPVSAADVELVRGTQPGASIFDLASAIGRGTPAEALRILARNLEAGEAPVRLLGSLVWQYRRIWKAKDLVGRKASESELIRACGLPPYRLKAFLAELKYYSDTHLQTAFDLFLKTDSRLKGGGAGAPGRELERLILALCAESAPPQPIQAKGTIVPPAAPPVAGAGRTKPISNLRTIKTFRPSAR
jgi:DNA polymerase-3 subunit delta